MANLSALDALRLVTLYIKEYVNTIADQKLDSDAIDPVAIQTALSALDTRISTIVAGAGNSDASSAELLDARVSSSNVQYSTLGNHIRAIETGAALGNGAVSSAALADGAVTPDKLADSFLEQYYTAAQVDDKLTDALPSGTVAPVAKTAAMTQPVGIGTDGQLYTTPTDVEALTGVMLQSVYDTQGIKTDVFLFARARANDVRTDMKEITDALDTALGKLKTEIQSAYTFDGETYDSLSATMTGIENAISDVVLQAKNYAERYAQAMLKEYKAFTTQIVDELPLVGESMTFYLVKKQSGYEKYWWIQGTDGEYMWDSFGSSSTLVLAELPDTGAEDVDYIIENGDSYVYYKWIDGQWKVVAGSLVVVLRAGTDEDGTKVDGQLPVAGNELTDYYLETANGGYRHYRWIDGAFVLTGGDIENDAAFLAVKKLLDETADKADTALQDINNLQAQMDNLKGYVSDITESEDGITVSYGDGTSKDVPTKSTAVTVEDVDETEEGYRITYTNGDTKEIAGKGTGTGGSTSGGAAITRISDATLYGIYGSQLPIIYNFNAFDAAGDTVGAGVATWYVNGIAKATSTANQGDNEFDIGPYLAAGANSIKLSISVDTGGDSNSIATKTWTVNAVNLYFEWERDDSAVSTTAVAIRWTPYGDLSKTTHIIVDGDTLNEITSTTTRSGTLQTYVLPALSHGSHLVEMYVTATVNGLEIKTGSVYHDFIFTENGNTTPIIGSSYVGGNLTQYDTVAIPIVLYDPSSITANADIYIDGEKVTTWSNIDRTVHYWNYSPTTAGTHVLKMVCGTTERTWTVNVTELSIDNSEVEGYSFRMKASEFAGNDALQAWSSNGVTAAFSDNFDWSNGGIQSETDSDGNIRQYICIKAGTTMTINHKLFGADCTTDGKNIKVMFRLANCRDYDAQWLSCYSGGIGLRCFAQQAMLNSEQSEVSVPYYEGTPDPIELEFDVTPKTDYSYIMPWIDGVRSGVTVYPSNDAFVQTDAQDIVIGSPDCDVYLYMIKAYPNDLTEDNHLENFIADAPNPQEMLDRYNRNDILDSSGNISYLKLAQQNPDLRVHVYDIVEMFKGDKDADAIAGNSYRMFLASEDMQNAIYTAENVKMKIQGTSSVGYYDASANWDSEFTEGLTDKNGNHIDGIAMTEQSMPVSYQNNKVNQASCEGANNAIIADWYNTYQPYIRPYRYNNPMVRDTMEFQPGVAFFHDKSGGLWGGDAENYNMYAVIACGNSKKNYAVFHDPDNPLECCMEVVNNTSEQCLMTVACSDADVRDTNYFEFRYPKAPTDDMYNGWKRFVNWMYESNPNGATGALLPASVTYGDYTIKGIDEEQALNVLKGTVISDYSGTYEYDTFEYRMAKMLNECEDYMVLDSVSYHYLFIERHTMIDNVAKNTFWGSHDLVHWYLVHDYDNDTADGNDNEGGLTLTYGYEAMDTIGTKNVFNASGAVWFNFVHNLYAMNRAMYINREAAGAWNTTAFLQRFTDWQSVIPERVKNQDYWYKYLRRYEENQDDGYLAMLEGGQKTYQRWQFEVYQGAYMASKYIGSEASNDRITMRTYTPTSSGLVVTPKNEITITMYAKMYITILVGSIRKQIKAERGQAYTLNFDEAGSLNDTETYIYSASMVQAIGDISHLYPGYMAFANAIRLRSIQVSSTVEGYSNSNATSLTFGANKMLETLICPNLPNVVAALDLGNCQSLRYIDARGSGFTGFTFATGGVLETAMLPAPASISLRKLSYLTTFSMESYDNLTSVTIDSTPGIDSQNIATQSENLARIRLIGVDWVETETEVSDLLARLYTLRGRDENDSDIAQSVITGTVFLINARQQTLNKYAVVWANLIITYRSLVAQYTLTFMNADETPILDKNGNAYVQYVDREGDGYDPLTAGEIDTPAMAATQSTVYTFAGWDDNLTSVTAPRTVRATYTETPVQYKVRWYGENDSVLEEISVDYGKEAVYNGSTPTDASEESSLIFKVFLGWDKSTNCVTEDMDVYPRWQSMPLPIEGKGIDEMNLAELYGIVRTKTAANYITADNIHDRFPLTMGYEPDFSNVESVLLAENLALDGATSIDTGVKILNEDQDWTMVVDGVFDTSTVDACLVSCFTDTGYHGFKVKYSSGFAVQWSTNTQSSSNATTTSTVNNVAVVTAQSRDLAVLRHVKGSKNLLVYISKPNASAIITAELTKTIETVSDATIVFGSDNEGANFATGMLYRCKLWYADLGDAECRKMAAWPREECYLETIGTAGIKQSNGQKSNIDFIHAGLMCCIRQMNPTNSNAGGWPVSGMRTWLHSRYVNGLPEAMRNMLLEVITSSVGYVDGTSSEILESNDLAYIPSYREMGGNDKDKEPWIYCGNWIPWFTSNALRIKFRGLTIPEDAVFTTAVAPPSTPKVGDIWIYSSNSTGYIWNGRFWVQAPWYWLRDAWVSSASAFANVNNNGNVNNNNNASSSYGVLPRLHI